MLLKVDIKNSEILETLNKYSDWFFSQDLNRLPIEGASITPEEVDQIISDEERKKVENNPEHIGYPLRAKGLDLKEWGMMNDRWKEKISKFNFDFKRQLGARHDALHMYYPENGFISWHTNENAPGKNIIFTYSTDGLGFFKYLDPDDGKIKIIRDEKGWNAKMSEFGRESEHKIWHCARNYGPRLTISYIIQNDAMWEDVKEELEDEC